MSFSLQETAGLHGVREVLPSGWAEPAGHPAPGHGGSVPPPGPGDLSNVWEKDFKVVGVNAGDFAGAAIAEVEDLKWNFEFDLPEAGDGINEMMIGAPGSDRAGENAGAAYLIYGRDGGDDTHLGSGARGSLFLGENPGDYLGAAVGATAPQGPDGRADILIGAPGNDQGGDDAGAVYVIRSNLAGTLFFLGDGRYGFKIVGEEAGGHVGLSASAIADLNGDGLDEFLIGGRNAAYVVWGKESSANVALGDVAAGTGGFKIAGEEWQSLARGSLTSIADLNGDGLDEILVGVPGDGEGWETRAGAAYVVWGKTDGAPVDFAQVANGVGGFKIVGGAAFDRAGTAVAGIGDLNADGLGEIIIGAPGGDGGWNLDAGAVYVAWGKADGSPIDLDQIAAGIGGFRILGENAFDNAGVSVAAADDLNGDGLPDILIGATGNDQGGTDAGAVYAVWGKGDGATVDLRNVAAGLGGTKIQGEDALDHAGSAVATLGHLKDGQRLSDILIGAVGDEGADGFGGSSGQSVGAVHQISPGVGGGEPPDDAPDRGYAFRDGGELRRFLDPILPALWTEAFVDGIHPDPNGLPPSGSPLSPMWDDINANGDAVLDGPGDLEKFWFDGVKMFGINAGDYAGIAVAAVDDVHPPDPLNLAGYGDGVNETIVGAPGNDRAGQDAGAAYLVYGWDAPENYLTGESVLGNLAILGENPGDYAGMAVGSIADLNGDDRTDILVGAPGNDQGGDGAGAAYVAWTDLRIATIFLDDVAQERNGFKILGEEAGGHAGLSVTAIADLNGDGLGEILVGGGNAAYVVWGKGDNAAVELRDVAAGIGGFKIAGEDEQGFVRGSVTAMDDMNGDGLGEILIGAPGEGGNAGAAYVVWGKADGVAIDLAAVAGGQGGFKIIGGSAFDRVGTAVAGIGDLNGDGLGEIIIGAPGSDGGWNLDAGAVYVAWGKADGSPIDLDQVAAGIGGFRILGENAFDNAGVSVAAADDVNYDGLPDILIGATGNDQGGINAGAVYAVWGKGDGAAVDLRDVAAGTGGLKILGEDALDHAGSAVAMVHRLNFYHTIPDILMGAAGDEGSDDFGGSMGQSAGAAYQVFGSWTDYSVIA
jgi:hypothetical protein